MDNLESGTRPDNTTPAKQERDTVHPGLSVSGRVFAALEHAWFQRVVGMAAVLFGFFDGRYFSAISLMLPLAIHRSKSLRGIGRVKQAAIYITTFCVLFALLWAGGKRWNRSRDNLPLIKQIVEAVGDVKMVLVSASLQPATRTATAPVPAQIPPPKTTNPKLLIVAQANDLADKIENVGDDYKNQLEAERNRQRKLETEQEQMNKTLKEAGKGQDSADYATRERSFSDLRMDKISKYELKRYADLYKDPAIAIRSKMLELINDIPPPGLDTTMAVYLYQTPASGTGLKEIAANLRALASAYKARVEKTLPKTP